jgi:hypothetical protein
MTSARHKRRSRCRVKVDTKHLTPTEVDRAAGLYPVFRVEPPSPIDTSAGRGTSPPTR